MNQWPQVLLLGGLTSDRARPIVSPRPRISGSFPGELALTDRTRALQNCMSLIPKTKTGPENGSWNFTYLA
jgi:hypothetical protein